MSYIIGIIVIVGIILLVAASLLSFVFKILIGPILWIIFSGLLSAIFALVINSMGYGTSTPKDALRGMTPRYILYATLPSMIASFVYFAQMGDLDTISLATVLKYFAFSLILPLFTAPMYFLNLRESFYLGAIKYIINKAQLVFAVIFGIGIGVSQLAQPNHPIISYIFSRGILGIMNPVYTLLNGMSGYKKLINLDDQDFFSRVANENNAVSTAVIVFAVIVLLRWMLFIFFRNSKINEGVKRTENLFNKISQTFDSVIEYRDNLFNKLEEDDEIVFDKVMDKLNSTGILNISLPSDTINSAMEYIGYWYGELYNSEAWEDYRIAYSRKKDTNIEQELDPDITM